MKNWKTTLIGCGTAVIYAALGVIQTGNLNLKDIAMAAGIALLGTLAKDFNVSGFPQ